MPGSRGRSPWLPAKPADAKARGDARPPTEPSAVWGEYPIAYGRLVSIITVSRQEQRENEDHSFTSGCETPFGPAASRKWFCKRSGATCGDETVRERELYGQPDSDTRERADGSRRSARRDISYLRGRHVAGLHGPNGLSRQCEAQGNGRGLGPIRFQSPPCKVQRSATAVLQIAIFGKRAPGRESHNPFIIRGLEPCASAGTFLAKATRFAEYTCREMLQGNRKPTKW